MKVGCFHVSRGVTPHERLARILIASVRQWMPTVPIVHFTDTATRALTGVDEVRRRPAGPIALGCLDAYAAAGEGDWLFVDTDVVIQRDVRWIFDRSFDLAVASREGTLLEKEVGTTFMASMPHNKGAVFSRSPAFWRAAAAHLRTLSAKRQEWMGDQVAMNAVIASGAFTIEILDPRYNWPPKHADDVRDKAILHYKGKRKAWILDEVSA